MSEETGASLLTLGKVWPPLAKQEQYNPEEPQEQGSVCGKHPALEKTSSTKNIFLCYPKFSLSLMLKI